MSKEIKLGFDVATLSNYTNENTDLVARAIYGAKTIAGGVTVLEGQKGNVKLNKLAHTLALQAAACGWTVSGSTQLTQQAIDICSIDYKEALCPKTLEPLWYGQIMAKGSNPTEIPFAQYIVDTKMKELSAQVELLFWQGNNSTGTGDLVLCDGLWAFLSGNTSTPAATNDAVGTPAAGTIIGMVNAMVTAIDERVALEPDLKLYMSVADYKMYTAALRTANLFHYNGEDGDNMETNVPGTNVTVVATPWLVS